MPTKTYIANRTYLNENLLPKQWYNILADLPTPLDPAINSATMKPATKADFTAIFPSGIIDQEFSTDRYIPIPKEVQEAYKSYRSSPLIRAHRLEKFLDTPARIYFKYEGNNPSGSHKLNSAIPQVYYNKIAGVKKLTTETGAGQWGTALSYACSYFGLDCEVFMVRVSYDKKPFRKSIMQTFGATVHASPSNLTNSGRAMLANDPDTNGSLGMAISEAVEVAATHDDTNYSLGSVLNHVVLHQTIIGQEAMLQMESIGETPDMIIGCAGGGSNLAGIALPFLGRQLRDGGNIKFMAVEPTACPSFTRGKYAYDYGDNAGFTPIIKMYTLGHDFMPAGIHAGGLRYHGMSPILSKLYHDKLISACAVKQTDVFRSATLFAKYECILPAPESAHAIHKAIQEAIACKETGEEKVILFCLSGHGDFDLAAYDNYNQGNVVDVEFTDEQLAAGLKSLPVVE